MIYQTFKHKYGIIQFAEKGYDNARTEEITAVAGVAKGSLYYHFSKKEDIFDMMLNEGIDNGEFFESDVEATASAIFGVTVSSLLYRLKKNRKVDVEKVYKGFIDNVTRTLSKKI